VKHQKMNCPTGCMSCEQIEIMNTYRRLWTEHVVWTRFVIVSIAFGLPDLPLITARLLRNPMDFANELRPLYGDQIAMRFEVLLTEHLVIAADLVVAAKAGNAEEVNRLRKLWYQNAKEIADFLACINPCWSESLWRELLFDHLRMTEDEAVAILTGQYEKSIEEFDAIQAQALKMAEVMACGIIRQFGLQGPSWSPKGA